MLAELQAGTGFDQAVLASAGIPVTVFESDWTRTIRRRYNLAIWLSAGGFWLVVSLAVGVVWWIRRRADRPRRRALDDGWIIPDESPGPEM
jgi:hypothetical protein